MTQPPLQPPPPPPPVDPSTGWLQLTLQGSTLTSSVVPPTVRLNGYPVPTAYGLNTIPLPAGRWHLDVHCQWLRQFGQAALDFDLAPGQQVPVFYAAPLHQFTTGSIGFQQQKRRGLGCFVTLMVLLALLVALIVIAAVIA